MMPEMRDELHCNRRKFFVWDWWGFGVGSHRNIMSFIRWISLTLPSLWQKYSALYMCLEEKRYKTISELNIGRDILCPWREGWRSQWWQMFLPLLTSYMVPEADEQGAEMSCTGGDYVYYCSSTAGIYGINSISGFWHNDSHKVLQRRDGSGAGVAEWDWQSQQQVCLLLWLRHQLKKGHCANLRQE